jgi:hypothetical protein
MLVILRKDWENLAFNPPPGGGPNQRAEGPQTIYCPAPSDFDLQSYEPPSGSSKRGIGISFAQAK